MEIRVEKLSLSFYDFLLEQDSVWAGLNARGTHARLALFITVFVEAGFSRDLLVQRAYERRFFHISSLKTFIRRQQEMPGQIAQGRMKKGPLKNLSLPEIPSMLRHLLSLRQPDPTVEKIRMQESLDPTILNLEVYFEAGTFPVSSLRQLPELLTGNARSKLLHRTLGITDTVEKLKNNPQEFIDTTPKHQQPDCFFPKDKTFIDTNLEKEKDESEIEKTIPPTVILPPAKPPRPRRPCLPPDKETDSTYLEKWKETRVPIDKR